MKRIKVSFDTWIQLLGMVGVLGGLVFVGLEMQQTQRIALAGQVQARDQRGIDRIIAGLEGNLTALKLFYENDWSYEELTSEEKTIAISIFDWRWRSLQNNFIQYQMGMFPEEFWELTKIRIENTYNRCDMRFSLRGGVQSWEDYIETVPNKCME